MREEYNNIESRIQKLSKKHRLCFYDASAKECKSCLLTWSQLKYHYVNQRVFTNLIKQWHHAQGIGAVNHPTFYLMQEEFYVLRKCVTAISSEEGVISVMS